MCPGHGSGVVEHDVEVHLELDWDENIVAKGIEEVRADRPETPSLQTPDVSAG